MERISKKRREVYKQSVLGGVQKKKPAEITRKKKKKSKKRKETKPSKTKVSFANTKISTTRNADIK